MKKMISLTAVLVMSLVASAFSELSEKDMDILYKNPPGAKKVKFAYVVHKPSVTKDGNKLYKFTLVQVSSGATTKWNIRIDCGSRKLSYGCGIMTDNNGKVTMKTKSCDSRTFEPFKVPKDKDWQEVVRVFCERYDK